MNCIRCQNEIHPLRIKALPGTKVCVNCSVEQPKRGRSVTFGQGDHTYTEIEILPDEVYRQLYDEEDYHSKKIEAEKYMEEDECLTLQQAMAIVISQAKNAEDELNEIAELLTLTDGDDKITEQDDSDE